jgi:hypothetical protein
MKYQWTDWITHVPGQELLPGTYGLFEFQGKTRNRGRPYTKEGLITAEHRGHPVWRATKPGERIGKESWSVLRRYKLRSIAAEETVARTRRKRVPA